MSSTTQITKNSLRRASFAPNEFFNSQKAQELKIVNYPSKSEELSILTCLMSTADMLQEVRDLLNKPIHINSAYRCLEVNRALGSEDSSQHVQGLAADIIAPLFGTPEDIMRFLHSKNFLVDRCFTEGGWLHISRCLPKQVMNKDPNRMMYGYFLVDPKTKKRKFRPIA